MALDKGMVTELMVMCMHQGFHLTVRSKPNVGLKFTIVKVITGTFQSVISNSKLVLHQQLSFKLQFSPTHQKMSFTISISLNCFVHSGEQFPSFLFH